MYISVTWSVFISLRLVTCLTMNVSDIKVCISCIVFFLAVLVRLNCVLMYR